MLTTFRLWFDRLRTSLWFLPSLLVLFGLALSLLMLRVDYSLPTRWWKGTPFEIVFAVHNTAASAMLQAISSSIITVAGVVFSIVIVALSQASNQYTSRVMRNFIRDRANQAVLGAFMGIYVYCVMVLRSLTNLSDDIYAPAFSLFVALLMVLLAVGLLIFFVHHISRSLQASNIVARIAESVLPAFERTFPRTPENHEDPVDLEPPEQGQWHPVRSLHSGFVDSVNVDTLESVAEDADGIIRMRRGVGEFVMDGEIIAELRASEAADEDLCKDICDAWSLASQRTVEDDPSYGLRQLVDVALKALSPGVNETTTGIMCLNWIGELLMRVAQRRFPPRLRVRDGHVRVIVRTRDFEDYLALGLDQIRQSASGNSAVMERMLEILEALMSTVSTRARQLSIQKHADAIVDLNERTVAWEPDRAPVIARVEQMRKSIRS